MLLLLGSIYGYLKRKYFLYVFYCSLLLLLKEVYVLVPFYTFCFDVIQNRRVGKQQLVLLLPLITFFIWIGINKHTFGWYLNPYNVSLSSWTLFEMIEKVKQILQKNDYWIYIPVLGSILSLVSWRNKKLIEIHTSSKNTLQYLFGFICIFTMSFLILVYLPRYILPIYPLIYLCIAYGITQWIYTTNHWKIVSCLIAIPLISQCINMATVPIDPWGEEDLIRHTILNKKVFESMQTIKSTNAVINSPWAF